MALWTQNITPTADLGGAEHLYAVKVNRDVLVCFTHVRDRGAAECFRAAADALDAAGLVMPHDLQKDSLPSPA